MRPGLKTFGLPVLNHACLVRRHFRPEVSVKTTKLEGQSRNPPEAFTKQQAVFRGRPNRDQREQHETLAQVENHG